MTNERLKEAEMLLGLLYTDMAEHDFTSRFLPHWRGRIASFMDGRGPSYAPELPSEPRAARDADHCDYPDCEQHWTNVVAQARALLEPLAEHDPAIRQWLKTPDLPTLPGTSRDAPMPPDGFPREQRDHDTELEAQERRFKAQLRDELTEGPVSLVGALQDRLPDLNPGAVRAGRSVKSEERTFASRFPNGCPSCGGREYRPTPDPTCVKCGRSWMRTSE